MRCTDEELIALHRQTYSPQVRGLYLGPVPHFQQGTEVIASSEITVKQIHDVKLGITDDSAISDSTAILFSLLSLRSLHLAFGIKDITTIEVEERKVEIQKIFQWLGSRQCIVTDLSVTFPNVEPLCSRVLAVLPQMACLKKLGLNIHPREPLEHLLDTLFPALSKTPWVDMVYVNIRDELFFIKTQDYQKILTFQLASRPRLFCIDFGQDGQYPNCANVHKIHHVSLLFQQLQAFHQSKLKPSFPLSAWTFALEKLNDISELMNTDIQAVGVDARFSVLKELLGEPHRLVNHDELYKGVRYGKSKLSKEDDPAPKRQRKS